ncbi:hypothetical protein DSO57_1026051 [Entomophthora muscae]|uniref:Uncharacterized protein n=1 Tax=Entomophthora muscae TaxID=34485 RepID=A0ACC2U0L8_9FUNG|nr:hypothetical protein DSO57_1026051 [Entomophthora muscae]
MHPIIGLLHYISYNLILSQIITGRWGPVVGTLLSAPPNVNFMPANLGVVPPVFETENCVASQCPEFYSEDTLMLSKAIYLGLLWLGLTILLNPKTASYYPAISVTGGDSPPLGDSFLLSGNFCHTSLQESPEFVSDHRLGELQVSGNVCKCHAVLVEAHYLLDNFIGYHLLLGGTLAGPECPRQSASLPGDKTTNSVEVIANCLPRRKSPFLTMNGQGFTRPTCCKTL